MTTEELKLNFDRVVKKPRSAYILWCIDNLIRLREENNNPEFGEMNIIMMTKWKLIKKENGDEYKKYVNLI